MVLFQASYIGSYYFNSLVTKLLVKQGLVRVKQPDGKRSVSAELGQLLELEEKAKAEQKGVWGEEPPPRTILTVDEDQRVLINKHKDKKLPAIIEQVRDASSFKICLLVGENQYQYINFIISGIKSPVCRKDIPNMPDGIFYTTFPFFFKVPSFSDRTVQRRRKVFC